MIVESALCDLLGLDEAVDSESIVNNLMSESAKYKASDIKYTVYIPSKGRHVASAASGSTAMLMEEHGITNYKIVVEPQDYEEYAKNFAPEKLVQLPENDQGIAYARTFIKEYSLTNGEKFSWQMDDDMRWFAIRMTNKNERCKPYTAMGIIEETTDMFSNIGISGITSVAFAFSKKNRLNLNKMAYGVVLINNETEHKWRDGVSEDLDYSLQLLEDKYVSLSFNHICFITPSTGANAGGNQLNLFKDDNRKKMFEKTVETWPNRLKVIPHSSPKKKWALKQTRKFYADYNQQPIIRNDNDE